MRVDPSGYMSFWGELAIGIGVGILVGSGVGLLGAIVLGGITGGATQAIINIFEGNTITDGLLEATLISAAGGAVGYGLGKVISKVGKSIMSKIKGVSNLASYGDDFGKIGKYVEHPGIKVDWSKTTDHALKRMQQRGVSKRMVNSWVKNGEALMQNGGNKYAFITRRGMAVVAKDGALVTTYGRNYYDDAMKAIVTRLYG